VLQQEKNKTKEQLGHPLKIKACFSILLLLSLRLILWRVEIETVEEGVMREEEKSHGMNE